MCFPMRILKENQHAEKRRVDFFILTIYNNLSRELNKNIVLQILGNKAYGGN